MNNTIVPTEDGKDFVVLPVDKPKSKDLRKEDDGRRAKENASRK